MEQHDQTKRLARRNARLAVLLLILGFGTSVALIYVGRLMGSR